MRKFPAATLPTTTTRRTWPSPWALLVDRCIATTLRFSTGLILATWVRRQKPRAGENKTVAAVSASFLWFVDDGLGADSCDEVPDPNSWSENVIVSVFGAGMPRSVPPLVVASGHPLILNVICLKRMCAPQFRVRRLSIHGSLSANAMIHPFSSSLSGRIFHRAIG